MNWLELLAWVPAVVLSVPLVVLAVECLAAVTWRGTRWPTAAAADRPRCVVLIPAHDEEAGLGRTLEALRPQLGPADRVVVVADNCTDRTADVARAHGVGVVERSDPARRGKGYALAFGVDAIRPDPPDVVVVVDADCIIGDGGFARLVGEAHARRRPVQGAYRMLPPPGAGPQRAVAAFAFLVKNVVRPLGLRRLGQPCLLTGTGMAFPWAVIRDARLGHGHIVEDMQLAVDLAAAGHPAVFAPDVDVRGEFPAADRAAASQRRRWEHGHLRVVTAGVPRLLAAGVTKGRGSLVALAVELGVPPLSALVLVAGGTLSLLAVWAVLGGPWLPVAVLGSALAAAAVGLLAAWGRFGRGVLPASALVRIPWYAVRKVPLYLSFFTHPQGEWVRTQRDPVK